ncbi:MAG: hypothetical protein GY696_34530 [Gammaproteobacteria bacterium]|nr:hypothetical protein [Gammaproteobacteria bacterium]
MKKCGGDHHQLLHDYMMEKKTVAVVVNRVALNLTADMFEYLHPEAAKII